LRIPMPSPTIPQPVAAWECQEALFGSEVQPDDILLAIALSVLRCGLLRPAPASRAEEQACTRRCVSGSAAPGKFPTSAV
jgi:hypothetical protein